MTFLRSPLRSFAASAAIALVTLASEERSAEACGGCFVPPTSVSVVNDHRMAFAISQRETVLWDQIRYSGDPREFAWVLPVRRGARIELSRDEWFAALEASTQPLIVAPPSNCGQGSGGGGCGMTSSAESAASAAPGGSVEVIHQAVVGPYETVTLRAEDGDALRTWLRAHDFAIPPSIEPTIDMYVREKLDFLALRLQPGQGVRAMQPVRVVTPGADATLPLRMVAAGVGAEVGITLFVITEGRYHPKNFPDAVIDYTQLKWDGLNARSNYEELSQAAMRREGGRGWITEYAKPPSLGRNEPASRFSAQSPGLYTAYVSQCQQQAPIAVPCGVADAGLPGAAATDANADDANANDANANDANADDASASDGASSSDASGRPDAAAVVCGSRPACEAFDDLDVAPRYLHPRDVFVTRLRAVLPVSALSAGDLVLEPTANRAIEENVHQTTAYTDPSFDPCAGSRDSSCAAAPDGPTGGASYLAAGALLVGMAALGRRRRT